MRISVDMVRMGYDTPETPDTDHGPVGYVVYEDGREVRADVTIGSENVKTSDGYKTLVETFECEYDFETLPTGEVRACKLIDPNGEIISFRRYPYTLNADGNLKLNVTHTLLITMDKDEFEERMGI